MSRMIETGEILTSKDGYRLSPVPKINLKNQNIVMKRVDTWLLDNARRIAELKKDDWTLTLLKGVRIGNVSTADRDMLNLILFNEV